MHDAGAALQPGQRIPFLCGMTGDGRFYALDDQAGRPVAFVIAGAEPPAAVAPLLDAFADRVPELAARSAEVRVLVRAGAPGWTSLAGAQGAGVVHCLEAPLLQAAGQGVRVVVADRALRLVAVLDAADPALAAQQALDAMAAAQAGPPRPAPAMIIPGVLDAQACRRLIERFESGPHEEGTMASMGADGAPVNRVDRSKKHRRDLILDPADPQCMHVTAQLAALAAPEIERTFGAQVAYVDRVLIARYDDTGGYFRRHRDNSAANVAYREFAVSLNLNAGEYEGGSLLFPEYDDLARSPPTGAAFVFAASALHEAAPVTRGRRYVLLTFLHGEAAEARRRTGLMAA